MSLAANSPSPPPGTDDVRHWVRPPSYGSGSSGVDEMDEMGTMEDASKQKARGVKLGELGGLKKMRGKWSPTLGLSREVGRVATSAAAVDKLLDLLLAVDAGEDTRTYLVDEYDKKCREAGLSSRNKRNGRKREAVLTSMAHLILSLPEAQLN